MYCSAYYTLGSIGSCKLGYESLNQVTGVLKNTLAVWKSRHSVFFMCLGLLMSYSNLIGTDAAVRFHVRAYFFTAAISNCPKVVKWGTNQNYTHTLISSEVLGIKIPTLCEATAYFIGSSKKTSTKSVNTLVVCPPSHPLSTTDSSVMIFLAIKSQNKHSVGLNLILLVRRQTWDQRKSKRAKHLYLT